MSKQPSNGDRVKLIVEHIVDKYMFETYDVLPELTKSMQSSLDLDAPCRTIVDKFKGYDKYVSGKVYFIDENNDVRVLDITIKPAMDKTFEIN
jgi:hypothetical protein